MKNKNIIRLTESDLHRIIKETVKKVVDEEISMQEYGKYFDKLSNTLVDIVNNHPTIEGISCVKKEGRQWGEYNLVIKLPLHNNFNSREDIIGGVNELVSYISNSVMCNNYKVWGAFMENLYPSITNYNNTVTADVKYIKSTNILKIIVKIPYYVMKDLVDNTYPNVQTPVVDFFEDNGI